MPSLKKTLRTCVVCRGKFEQKELLRLKCEEKKLLFYNNYGRSFYICCDCEKLLQTDINGKDYKKIEKSPFGIKEITPRLLCICIDIIIYVSHPKKPRRKICHFKF